MPTFPLKNKRFLYLGLLVIREFYVNLQENIE